MNLNATVRDIATMNELELELLRLEILAYLAKREDYQMELLLNEVDQRLLDLDGAKEKE